MWKCYAVKKQCNLIGFMQTNKSVEDLLVCIKHADFYLFILLVVTV